MIGSVIRLLFFPCLKGKRRGNGEKEGKWGWKSLFFITFFNFIHPKISKKIGFRGSAFPFPPFSLEDGRKKVILNKNLTFHLFRYSWILVIMFSSFFNYRI